MKQLGELQRHAEEFKKLDAQLIFVFREERGGVEALKKIRDRHQTQFTLTLDLDKKSSSAYSSADKTFDNYVIDKQGRIAATIDGTLRERATAEELIKILKKLQASATDGSGR